MTFFKQRRIKKIRIKLVGLRADLKEQTHIANEYGKYYPIAMSHLVTDIAELEEELRQLGVEV